MEQPSPPELTSQVDQQVTAPVSLSVQEQRAGDAGFSPNHASTDVVTPIVEDTQKEANSTNDIDQTIQNPPVAVTVSQTVSSTEMPAIVKAPTDELPVSTSVELAVKDVAVGNTSKEQTSGTVDPAHVDKVRFPNNSEIVPDK